MFETPITNLELYELICVAMRSDIDIPGGLDDLCENFGDFGIVTFKNLQEVFGIKDIVDCPQCNITFEKSFIEENDGYCKDCNLKLEKEGRSLPGNVL